MPEIRLQCPTCKAVLKTTAAAPAGKSIKCPKCQSLIKAPAAAPTNPAQAAPRPRPAPAKKSADPDDANIERDEIDDGDEEVRPAPKKQADRKRRPSDEDEDDMPADEELADQEKEEDDEEDRPRKKSKKNRTDRSKNKGGKLLGLWLGIGGGVVAAVVVVLIVVLGGKKEDDGEEAREGSESDAHTVARRIDTKIPLPQREPFVMIRGILSLGGSADAGVIAVTSALSPRRYTINRATGKVIAEFDELDAKDPIEAMSGREVYTGQPLISPDGKLVIVRTHHRHNTFKIRDVATGNVVKVLGGDPITHFGKVAFSLNGDTLYALVHAKSENVLAGWRVADWQQVCHIKIPENREPGDLFPLADGKTVVTLTRAAAPRKAQADFFDVREQTFIRAFVLASWKDTRSFAVSSDGKLLAVVGDNGDFNRALEVYDMDNAKHISTVAESRNVSEREGFPVDGFYEMVGGIRFLSSGRLAVLAGKHVATYDPTTGAQKAIWKHDGTIGGRQITHLSLCGNGEILLVLDGDTATILVVRLKE